MIDAMTAILAERELAEYIPTLVSAQNPLHFGTISVIALRKRNGAALPIAIETRRNRQIDFVDLDRGRRMPDSAETQAMISMNILRHLTGFPFMIRYRAIPKRDSTQEEPTS
jgi:hypothetical protein